LVLAWGAAKKPRQTTDKVQDAQNGNFDNGQPNGRVSENFQLEHILEAE
jgi:hypothetical protein